MNPEQRNELLNMLGLGPRECADCGVSFTPPPYLDCKDVEVCPACGYERFEEWCSTEEGKREIAKFNNRHNGGEQ